MKAKSDEDRN